MIKTIYLIRHAQSMKNALKICFSVDGNERLTHKGLQQLSDIVQYFKDLDKNAIADHLRIICSDDRRSKETAKVIADTLEVSYQPSIALKPNTDSWAAGKLLADVYRADPDFENDMKLYRSGLLSAYDVRWPEGSIKKIQTRMEQFIEENIVPFEDTLIVVAHKSTLTGLAILLMRQYQKYPSDFYGYINISSGTGIRFTFLENQLVMEKIIFSNNEEQVTTDVIMKDGVIQFPESACAVCWKEERLLLVRQVRKGRLSWELPGGKLETGESAERAAKRELLEEAGISAAKGQLLQTLDLDLSVSYHRTYLVVFHNILDQRIGEFRTEWIPLKVLEKMLHDGEITHAPTMVAVLMKQAQVSS